MAQRSGMVTAVVCAAFDPATDAAILHVRDLVRTAGVDHLPPQPPHRPHFSLSAARVSREALDEVLATAEEVSAAHGPFPLIFTEVGRFGRAGVVWLGPAPTRELAGLQRDVYRALKKLWPPAFGDRSSPRLWVPHCTLATRVPKPQLRAVQAALGDHYEPIRGQVDALATILVGGHGDVGLAPLARQPGPSPRT